MKSFGPGFVLLILSTLFTIISCEDVEYEVIDNKDDLLRNPQWTFREILFDYVDSSNDLPPLPIPEDVDLSGEGIWIVYGESNSVVPGISIRYDRNTFFYLEYYSTAILNPLIGLTDPEGLPITTIPKSVGNSWTTIELLVTANRGGFIYWRIPAGEVFLLNKVGIRILGTSTPSTIETTVPTTTISPTVTTTAACTRIFHI